MSALERLRREHPELTLAREPIEALAIQEARRYLNFLSLHAESVRQEQAGAPTRCCRRRLLEQMARLRNRVFKLLTSLYPPADIDAAR